MLVEQSVDVVKKAVPFNAEAMSDVDEEGFAPYPFDIKKISIESKSLPISTIVRRLKSKRIHAAEMQRDEELWNAGTKSRLIESILLRIPLPLFYAAENKEGYLYIVDGLQRISAIRAYVTDESFKLEELEFLRDLEGKTYGELTEDLQIRIDETNLQFAIISSDSPPEVQRNIFKRLNTGGVPLSEQEIRHALFFGPATDLLKELVAAEEFKSIAAEYISDRRMMAREFVLRFLAFAILGEEAYRTDGEMDSFLCDAMQIINGQHPIKDFGNGGTITGRNVICKDAEELKKRFLLAMKRARQLFGSYAFRMSIPNSRRSRVNKALFETWSIVLSELNESDFSALLDNRDMLFEELSALYTDDVFGRNCGRDALRAIGVKGRYESIRSIVRRFTIGG